MGGDIVLGGGRWIEGLGGGPQECEPQSGSDKTSRGLRKQNVGLVTAIIVFPSCRWLDAVLV